ncbi:hypothetical protein PoMZ_05097 [Pyricularia oryzae]|uniref:Uncharacterized protein n=1 Tax=Pyricularia oryzae TaxID=318829 RepID=A0A4P7NNZ4_PYROR|nr:hypothetical protein PoMZ_05097 [Pyricularia oryzae]
MPPPSTESDVVPEMWGEAPYIFGARVDIKRRCSANMVSVSMVADQKPHGLWQMRRTLAAGVMGI